MIRRNQWEEFFDARAPFYMENAFTKNTVAEVDFILDELRLPGGSRVLDTGCGTGRHAVELAKRGFRVTGVDISAGMLAEAEKAANEAKVSVHWIHTDATTYKPDERFDAALCLCERAFSLIDIGEDPEEHDRVILKNINMALYLDAPFMMTTLNGYRKIRELSQEDVDFERFDPVSMIHHLTEEMELSEGERSLSYKERLYILPELVALLHSHGFQVEQVWGGTAGDWGRRKLNLDEFEVMIVASKIRDAF